MGFFDRSKRVSPQPSSERLLPFEYSFECCGTAQTFATQVPIMQDGHNVYMSLRNRDTGKIEMAKLPVATVRANQQGKCILVESLGDLVEGKSSDLSKERIEELILGVQCQKCGYMFPYIMAVAMVIKEQGGVMLSQRTDRSDVHELPFAILDYYENENSFELHSIL